MIENTSSSDDSTNDEPNVKKQDDSTGSLFALLQSYKEVTSNSTKLILADTRLAITSVLQILVLGIIAILVVFCLWLLFLAALGLWLTSGFGMTPAGLVYFYIGLHALFLVLITLGIRSTHAGLRFSATRELIPLSQQD